ncbi:ribose-5-phosphate isomerase RpiA [Parvularcula maris]|uniref:Ribose-5-phosphate isomerase A n=1 Tax=Parvularcula maris TaxID=2965077 RepID=A0A9X2L901_9PROT|nr:ribose-5-phosphate isomerase RpiA [Parvularcula maris]MCQ8185158.1 ribose-5-phosphate isomerase RpiA [Parvularcula maris]
MTSAKRHAANAALELIGDGMKLGLGTGSTAALFLDALAEKVRGGLDIEGVPTSQRTEERARELGIPLFQPDETTRLDLVIDGADEIDAQGRMIKGGGGAMLGEKIVASAAAKFVLVADVSKRVGTLGRFPLPVEVVPFAYATTIRAIRETLTALGYEGAKVELRGAEGGGFAETDSGNLIADLHLGRIMEPEELDAALTLIPGVVTTGLFIGFDVHPLIADENGIT